MHPGSIKIADYTYELPPERIAQYPLEHRDESRLLIYKDELIREGKFKDLPGLLPESGRIIFNETKVIPARILLRKPTGARIEIFCLEPAGLVTDYHMALQQGPGCEWICLVGNAKRWKEDRITLEMVQGNTAIQFSAEKVARNEDHFTIRFEWTPKELSFSEVLELAGKIPLPPYIHREADENDRQRYQTVFAREAGSIAAPTAGLHFTGALLEKLAAKHIASHSVNLHVGAGTFKPVSSETLSGHAMHTEFVSIPLEVIRTLLTAPEVFTTLVGTTTVRTMESLYWQGVKWMNSPPGEPRMDIGQWDPYENPSQPKPSLRESLDAVVTVLERHRLAALSGYTSLLIAPGYSFKIPDAIITNFHMPHSTLLLLIAAFMGDDWKKAYQFALDRQFRFLSYGDSCLLFKPSI